MVSKPTAILAIVVFASFTNAHAAAPEICALLREEPEDAEFHVVSAGLWEVSQQFRRLFAQDESRFVLLQTTPPGEWEAVTGIPAPCAMVFQLAQALGVGRQNRKRGMPVEVPKFSEPGQPSLKRECSSSRPSSRYKKKTKQYTTK